MFCHKCGNQLSADAIFCEKCGTKVLSASPTIAVSEQAKSPDQPSQSLTAQEPGRGTLILILGILSLVFFGPFTGIPAWVMGSGDLKKISRGIIPKSEKSATKAGLVLGIIGTCLIFGIIVFGIALAVGITMFSDSAISANRDSLTNDLVNLASRAQQFYRRPSDLGGGGNSFELLTADPAGMKFLTNNASNANGSYSILVAGSGTGTAATVTFQGIGTEELNGMPVQVQVKVWWDRDSVWVVN